MIHPQKIFVHDRGCISNDNVIDDQETAYSKCADSNDEAIKFHNEAPQPKDPIATLMCYLWNIEACTTMGIEKRLLDLTSIASLSEDDKTLVVRHAVTYCPELLFGRLFFPVHESDVLLCGKPNALIPIATATRKVAGACASVKLAHRTLTPANVMLFTEEWLLCNYVVPLRAQLHRLQHGLASSSSSVDESGEEGGEEGSVALQPVLPPRGLAVNAENAEESMAVAVAEVDYTEIVRTRILRVKETKCWKYFLCVVNLALAVVGVVVFIVAWLAYSFGKSVQMISFMLVIGVLLLLLAALGLYGAWVADVKVAHDKRNWALLVYCVCFLLLTLAQFLGVILFLGAKQWAVSTADRTWVEIAHQHPNNWAAMQRALDCCGWQRNDDSTATCPPAPAPFLAPSDEASPPLSTEPAVPVRPGPCRETVVRHLLSVQTSCWVVFALELLIVTSSCCLVCRNRYKSTRTLPVPSRP